MIKAFLYVFKQVIHETQKNFTYGFMCLHKYTHQTYRTNDVFLYIGDNIFKFSMNISIYASNNTMRPHS